MLYRGIFRLEIAVRAYVVLRSPAHGSKINESFARDEIQTLVLLPWQAGAEIALLCHSPWQHVLRSRDENGSDTDGYH
jgi:hypothetical protein